jgi:Leucine-rich repeat (LRR) protein
MKSPRHPALPQRINGTNSKNTNGQSRAHYEVDEYFKPVACLRKVVLLAVLSASFVAKSQQQQQYPISTTTASSQCGIALAGCVCHNCSCQSDRVFGTAICNDLGLLTSVPAAFSDSTLSSTAYPGLYLEIVRGTTKIRTIQDSAFANSFTRLHLASLGIRSVEPGAFSSLRWLSIVDLSGNELRTVVAGSFTPSSTNVAMKIDLSWNFIETLEVGAFGSLVVDLNLTNNRISTIPKDLFDTFTSLGQLDLSGNLITTLSANTFARSLRNLTLARNLITSIDTATFINLTSLERLDLSENRISVWPDASIPSRSLSVIDLSYNRLRPRAVHNMFRTFNGTIDEFRLDRNLPDDFGYYDPYYDLCQMATVGLYLTRLTLSGSRIRFIEMCGDALSHLDLSYNNLTYIYDLTFYRLLSLRNLDLSHNAISVIYGNMLSGLGLLNALNLSDNRIDSLTLDLNSAPYLQTLIVRRNRLTHFTNVFFLNHSTLSQVDLSYNYIGNVSSQAFVNMSSLSRIDLSHNRIISVDSNAFVNLPNINEIDLSDNMLTAIDSSVFSTIVETVDPNLFGSSSDLLVDLTNNQLQSRPLFLFQYPYCVIDVILGGNRIESVEPFNETEFSCLGFQKDRTMVGIER